MEWSFSIGWFFLGMLILAAGGAVVVFHQWIGNNLASGINSYEKIKFWGVITSIVGLLIMANLHTAILGMLINLVLRK